MLLSSTGSRLTVIRARECSYNAVAPLSSSSALKGSAYSARPGIEEKQAARYGAFAPGTSVGFERLALNLESILKELLQLKELSVCACCQEFFIPQLGERRQFTPISGPEVGG
jgi:hypothetical protein